MIKQLIKDYKGLGDQERLGIVEALVNDNEGLIAFFRLVGRRTAKEIYLKSYERED